MTHVTEHFRDHPPQGDDQPVIMKRWWMAIILAAVIPIGLQKFQTHERDAEIAVMKEQIARIDQVIQMYEGPQGLRVQRAQEIARLQEQMTEMQRTVDRSTQLTERSQQVINDKLERLLLRGGR